MKDPRFIALTGASSGLGAALALAYAAPGVRLALHGRDERRLAHVAEESERRGATVTTKRGDVRDVTGMAEWVASCARLQPLDVLIANAGISGGKGGGESDSDVRDILAVNLIGVLNTIHPAVELMKERGAGQIALVSSLAGFCGLPGGAGYCASKAAVRLYGEGLRAELAPHGVQVNVMCPGYVKTPMTDRNPFPMPFLMSAERAAARMKQGLANDEARIAFPWPLYAPLALAMTLPQNAVSRFMAWGARHVVRR